MLLNKTKKSLSIILTLSMLFSVSASAANISNQTENNVAVLSVYVNNEVFVMYANESFEVVAYA